MSYNHESTCQIAVDNSDHVLKIMKNIYHDKRMCDVFLTVGKKEHATHRLILCASSDVFQAMLMKPEWSEWNESRVVLRELPQCEPVFHHFLEYFYTGKIIITHTNVMAILCLADKYIVKSLTWLCIDYMINHIPHASAHNVLFSWLQYTIPCGHMELAEKCLSYIKWNLELVANTPEFSEFEAELFVNLLQQNDIVVYNEMVLYNFVIRWLDLQKIRMQQSGVPRSELQLHMKSLIEVAMSYIRFPMMSPRELADLLLSPLIKEHKEFFVERMAMGMMYHSGQVDRLKELCSTDDGRRLLTPRLYTCDSYSAVLIIDNVLSVPSYHTSTFVFSTHMSVAECENDRNYEWMVDLYPKGVWFKQSFLIVWQGTLQVPEQKYEVVRLALTFRGHIGECEDIKVKIGILLYAKQGGTEHVKRVIERAHYFTAQDRILNIDNFIPFEDMNNTHTPDSKFLVGLNSDQLKFNIIITPLRPDLGVLFSESSDTYKLINDKPNKII
ncbi:PREDICTED: BTB/POZ domain-containing protein 17 isoform X2 [Nicrophorus vespilloides]|nr:PREDICTED: BTB/POZ domain-containing protein 17 isoform X2 [Nicrophorus vespilloides]